MRQAEAIRRQTAATIAYGVRIGMAEDGQGAMDTLELTQPLAVVKEQLARSQWDMMMLLGGGKSV